MTRQEIFTFLKDLLRELEWPADPDTLTEDSLLREVLLDSMGVLEFVSIVERTFKFPISEEELNNRGATFGDLINLIERSFEAKAQASATTPT